MRKIFKYELKVITEQVIEMPCDAHILSVQLQNSIPCLWAIVDPEKEILSNVITMAVTGEDFPLTEYTHLATLQNNGIVIHVFHTGITFNPSNLT